MFRKYRIASKVRFTIFTSVLLIIIFMCLATVFGTSGISGTSIRALTARTTTVTTPLVRISPVHEKSAVHVVPDWALTREVNRGMAA